MSGAVVFSLERMAALQQRERAKDLSVRPEVNFVLSRRLISHLSLIRAV